MRLFIPTFGRVQKQITWNALPPQWRERTTLVCTAKEAGQLEYFDRVPKSQLLIQPERITTIAVKRQFIVEHAAETGPESILMLDDDLQFHARDPNGSGSLRRSYATPDRVDRALSFLEYCMDMEDFVHAGLGSRQGNNRHATIEQCTRAMHIIGCRPQHALELGADFSTMPVREDFHFTLHLLKKGFHNILLHDVAAHPGAFNAAGGASTERTVESNNAAADALAAAHPGLVRVEEKAYRQSLPRKEVVVQWKRAFKGDFLTSARMAELELAYHGLP